jgi:hypothetical protein
VAGFFVHGFVLLAPGQDRPGRAAQLGHKTLIVNRGSI